MSSDTKALNLTSLVSKKTRRAKARLLQNFGKADKTTDELLEVYQTNFNRQHSTALNLQKHVKHYVHCLHELHEASKSLSQWLLAIHERDWPKHDVYENNAYELDHINEDLEEKLKESVLVPLEQYLGQFADMREKIAKRGRKLVDYDSQRHTFEALQQHQVGKQQDDSKLSKSRDQLAEAKRVYELLNNELHDELPALYDNRLPFIITVLQRLFSSKLTYHNDSADIQKSYLETVEQLAKATERGSLNSATSLQLTQSTTPNVAIEPPIHSNAKNQPATASANITTDHPSSDSSKTNPTNGTNHANAAAVEQADVKDANELPSPGFPSVTNKPPVLLHKVRATYKYLAEDEDELSFEAGEIIQVIEYDDPQEQEEGWLMGIKEATGQKGLFPANFTKEV